LGWRGLPPSAAAELALLGRIFTLVPVPLVLIGLVAPDETADARSEQSMVPG
jgi:hypothetical protein